MKKVVLFFVSVIVLFFTSCEREDYTEPVEVDFEFSMDLFQMSDGAKQGLFEITKGSMVVQSIELDGRRDQGGDYFFTSGFSTPLKAELHNKTTNQKVKYDIPQGIYNRIELNFSLGTESENSLQFEGRFQRGPMEEIPVVFEYSFQEQVRIKARNGQGSDQIVISKDKPLKAKVKVNVPNMFQFVNMNMIKNAQISQYNGQQIIKINNTENTDIFNLMASRFDDAFYVVFE